MPNETLSGLEARLVFLTSFFFSQGHPTIQEDLFRAVALLRPHWRLAEADRQAVVAGLLPVVEALVDRGSHTALQQSIQSELEIQSLLMQEELAQVPRSSTDRDELLVRLLLGLVA